jgi:uncharacterized protein YndB with AHSA1/START domain
MGQKIYKVERSTVIDAPPGAVYRLVADFRSWTRWSPWEDVDPQLDRAYSGAETGVGAVYEWSGNRKAGKGRMEITEAVKPTSVRITLDFIKPIKSRNDSAFTFVDNAGQTTVTWTMTGPFTVFTKVAAFFGGMDKLIGKDFEKGLAQLATAAQGG